MSASVLLDYEVRCEGRLVDVRVDVKDAERVAWAESLKPEVHGALVTVNRCGRTISAWSSGRKES